MGSEGAPGERCDRVADRELVDPWADRQLARLALEAGDADVAIASLQTLDRVEGDVPEYAVELSRVYRGRKDYASALAYAERLVSARSARVTTSDRREP